MREFNDNFLDASTQASKETLYTIEIATDAAFTTLEYFTSSTDAQHPGGASVIDSVVKNISGTSQKIDPIKFVASIGSINFELLDKNSAVTALFNSNLDGGDGLREKRVRIYMGYVDLDWSDYEIIQTQIITGVVSDGPVYKISCSDIQRIEKKDIFDLAKTNIQSTVELPPSATLTVAITTTTGFSTITVSDTTDFASSGAILIGAEIITYTAKPTSTTFTGCVRGTNNSTAATHAINSSVYQTMYTVTVYDTSDFELNEHDAEYTDEPDQTVVYFKIDDEVLRATGKTSTTFTNCFRGALDTKPAEHLVDASKASDKRPEVEEYPYIETNAIKAIYGHVLGAWYNNPTSASLPANWDLDIDTIWVRNADFTGIGDDLWNNSVSNVNSGFKIRGSGLEKQDGKQFIEKEILPLIGCYMPIYAEGDIGLKRSTGVLSDAPYVVELNESNINQNSSLSITHNQKAVANKFIVRWGWSELRQDFTRKLTYVDADSIAAHQDAKPIELNFKLLHGNIHTESTIKRIVQRLRDRYAAPPIEMSLSVLPSLHGLEVGDIVRVNLDNVRDYTADSETLDRSFEVQQRSVNWLTGNVELKLFGSSAKPGVEVLSDNTKVLYNNDTTLNGAIDATQTTITLTDATNFPASGAVEVESESITYTGISTNDLTGCTRGAHGTANVSHVDTTAVHNSYYTDQGGTNIKSLASYSSNSINSESLTGAALFSNAVYYHTGPLTINTGQTVDWSNNLQLLIEGHVTWNGIGDASGGGAAGASTGDKVQGTKGQLPTLPSGGGIKSQRSSQTTKPHIPYRPFTGVQTYGYSRHGIDLYELDYDGSAINGLPETMQGSGGASGGSTILTGYWSATPTYYTADGGAGGDGGSGLLIISQGGSFGVNGSINTSGNNGSIGTTTIFTAPDDSLIYSGSGAGGAPGGVYWLMDGNLSTIPDIESKHTANYGTCTLPPTYVLLEYQKRNVPDYSLSKYISNGDVATPGNQSASRVQFLTDYVDEGEDENEWVPAGPTNLSATSGTADLLEMSDGTIISRINFSWTAATDKNVDTYEIGYLESDALLSTLRIIEDKPSRDITSTYIWPVIGGQEYILLIRTINVFGKKGDWSQYIHTVIGKTALPTTPTAFSTTGQIGGIEVSLTAAQMITDKDLKSIIIYSGTVNDIASATDIFSIAVTHSKAFRYKYDVTPGETRYHWISFLDTNLNESATYPADTSGQSQSASYAAGADVRYADNTPLDDLQPAAIGADVTQTAIDAGITTTTGSIVNTGKGAIDLGQTGVLPQLWINSSTWQASGIQLQYNSGSPRMYVGDGADKYIQFDGTDLSIGRDSKLLGSDSYNNDSIYYHMHLGIEVGLVDTGNVGTRVYDDYVTAFANTGATDYSLIKKQIGVALLTNPTWGKNRRFKTFLSPTFPTSSNRSVFAGIGLATGNFIGFTTDSTNSNVWGISISISTGSSTKIDLGVSFSTSQEFEAVFTSGSKIEFYLGGSYMTGKDITTNLPTGTTDADYVLYMYVGNTAVTTASGMQSSEWKFQQDE